MDNDIFTESDGSYITFYKLLINFTGDSSKILDESYLLNRYYRSVKDKLCRIINNEPHKKQYHQLLKTLLTNTELSISQLNELKHELEEIIELEDIWRDL